MGRLYDGSSGAGSGTGRIDGSAPKTAKTVSAVPAERRLSARAAPIALRDRAVATDGFVAKCAIPVRSADGSEPKSQITITAAPADPSPDRQSPTPSVELTGPRENRSEPS